MPMNRDALARLLEELDLIGPHSPDERADRVLVLERASIDREALRVAVQGVLWNASNYPAAVQSRLLGQDITPLTTRVLDAVATALAEVGDGVTLSRDEAAIAARALRLARRTALWAGDRVDEIADRLEATL